MKCIAQIANIQGRKLVKSNTPALVKSPMPYLKNGQSPYRYFFHILQQYLMELNMLISSFVKPTHIGLTLEGQELYFYIQIVLTYELYSKPHIFYSLSCISGGYHQI